MDESVFNYINSFAGRNPILDTIGVFLAEYLIFGLLIFVAILFLKNEYRRKVTTTIIGLLIARFVIVEAIKRSVSRPRPFESIENVNLLIEKTNDNLSFSSGHTVILFSLAFGMYGTRFFKPLVFLAVLGSLARIFIGVHYPWDVVISIVIAGVVVMAVEGLSRKSKIS